MIQISRIADWMMMKFHEPIVAGDGIGDTLADGQPAFDGLGLVMRPCARCAAPRADPRAASPRRREADWRTSAKVRIQPAQRGAKVDEFRPFHMPALLGENEGDFLELDLVAIFVVQADRVKSRHARHGGRRYRRNGGS